MIGWTQGHTLGVKKAAKRSAAGSALMKLAPHVLDWWVFRGVAGKQFLKRGGIDWAIDREGLPQLLNAEFFLIIIISEMGVSLLITHLVNL